MTVAAAGCGSQSSQLDARALAVARRYAEAFYVAHNGKPAVSRNVSTLEIFLKRGGDSWRVFAVGTVEGSSAGTSILCGG